MVYDIKSNPLVSWSQYLKENRCSSSLQLNLKKWWEYEILWIFVCMRSLLYYTQMCCTLEWSYLLLEILCFLEGILFLFPFFIFLFFSFTIRDVFHKSPESQSVRTSWKWQHFSRNIFSLWSQQVMREKVILCKMQKLKSWKIW